MSLHFLGTSDMVADERVLKYSTHRGTFLIYVEIANTLNTPIDVEEEQQTV